MWYSQKLTGTKLWDQTHKKKAAGYESSFSPWHQSLGGAQVSDHLFRGHKKPVCPWTNAKSFNCCYSPVATFSWHLVWALKMASLIDKPSHNSEHCDPEGSIKECAIILPLCHFVNVSLNNDCYLASNSVYPEVHSPLRSCLPRRVQAQLWNPSPRRTFVLLLMRWCTKLYISSCDMLSD